MPACGLRTNLNTSVGTASRREAVALNIKEHRGGTPLPHPQCALPLRPAERYPVRPAQSIICMTRSLLTPVLPHGMHKRSYWRTPPGSAKALAFAEAARAHAGLLVVVAKDTHAAHQLESELRVFLDADQQLVHFADWETLPYDVFSPHPDIISQRISTLYRLPGLRRGVLVVPVATLMQRVAPRRFVSGSSLQLKVGQTLSLESERRRLDGAGYRNVPQVHEPGDYATRGALLDIFPMGSDTPFRIELLDEEIDSIRAFDPETQRSLDRLPSINLLPAREFPLTEVATKEFRSKLRERFDIDPRRSPIYQDLREGVAPAGIEYYLPLFFEQLDTLFDYVGDDALIALEEGALDAAEVFWKQVRERHDSRAHDIERPVLEPAELYLAPEQLRTALNLLPRIELVDAAFRPTSANSGHSPRRRCLSSARMPIRLGNCASSSRTTRDAY